MGLAALSLLALVSPSASGQDMRRRQEIVLGELPARAVTDLPFELTAKASSGLPVTFEVIDGPAQMDGKKVKLTGAPGLVIVRATQKGDVTFLPATPAERVFSVRPRPVAPTIVIQPSPATAGIGEPLTLSVEARGEPMPTFRWRKDGMDLSAGTQARLYITSATQQDAGSYDVVASNALGSATSASVRVAIGKRRQSITFPAQSMVTSGQSVTLGASASSGLPVEYRVLSGIAILSGGTLTPQQGTVVVEAAQRGDMVYEAAAPVTQTFILTPATTGLRFP
jgi:hypothetical protein